MSVIALQVSNSRQHPNADTLYIYELTAPERDSIQVIANRDNVYEPGDVVAVALVGTVLDDGTKIRRARLRGEESFGMALGPVEASPGADLTADYITPRPDPEPIAEAPLAKVVKWTSVEQLHYVRKSIEDRRDYFETNQRLHASDPAISGNGSSSKFVYPKVTYRAKVKLDGTNGGVQLLPSGDVVAQSRSRVISRADDNIEFAAWVDDNRAYFEPLAGSDAHTIIYGEWCGSGIQKRTAISNVDRRVFVVFAIQSGDHETTSATLEVEPARIRARLPEHPDIFVLPWHGEPVTLDFGNRLALQGAADRINDMVAAVEDCDPWVRAVFGVSGLGEGVVLYPVLEVDGPVARDEYTWLMFKAKGEKHQVVRQKRPAQVDPEVAGNIQQFVDLFVTEARLEQAVNEGCGGVFDTKKTGLFLKWIGQDVKKESPVELEASGLSWKDVSKAVANAARRWYQGKIASGEPSSRETD